MFNRRSVGVAFSALGSASLIGLSSLSCMAQTTGAADLQPWEIGGQTEAASDLNNPLSDRNGTGASSIFDLLNRIQTIQSQSGADFNRNQEKNFNKAVENFYKKQEAAIDAQPED